MAAPPVGAPGGAPAAAAQEMDQDDVEVLEHRRAPVEAGPPSLATPSPADSLAVANGRAPATPGSCFDHQRASGLFGADDGEAALVATRDALREALAAGITSADPIYGAQVKRAIEAVLALLADAPAATPRRRLSPGGTTAGHAT